VLAWKERESDGGRDREREKEIEREMVGEEWSFFVCMQKKKKMVKRVFSFLFLHASKKSNAHPSVCVLMSECMKLYYYTYYYM
jgi:hypothetical protein